MKSARIFGVFGACFALLSVAFGAFAAHSLKNYFSPDMLAVFETAARYQMYHSLALLIVAWIAQTHASKILNASGVCFLLGIFFFCGSLYVLAFTELSWLGMITPLGGIGFLLGWLFLSIHFFKTK